MNQPTVPATGRRRLIERTGQRARHTIFARLIAPWFLLLTSVLHAADISHEVRSPGSGLTFWELGAGLSYDRIPLVGWLEQDPEEARDGSFNLSLFLDGRLQWKNFFIEGISDSFQDGVIGFTLTDEPNQQLELVLSSQFGEYSPGDITGFENLRTRRSDATIGIRSLIIRDETVFQLELGKGVVSNVHRGWTAALLAGRQWQVQNWQAHAVAGLRYFSDDIVDYYFGVDDSETSPLAAPYSADSGTLMSLELGATKPINEKWLLRTALTLDRLPDSVVESPLATGRTAAGLSARIIRVF